MKLIKSTLPRKREVWLLNDRYRKIWRYSKIDLLERHVTLVNLAFPNYILDHGYDSESMWVDYKIIDGCRADMLSINDDLIKTIYQFCLEHIMKTAPFYHGDWNLSNIIMDGDNITMVDWDDINTDSQDQMLIKMHFDLRSSIGPRFDKFIDPKYLPKDLYRKKILSNVKWN